MTDDQEPDERECGEPCPAGEACDNCAAYWQRLVDQGFWDRDRNRWTDKAWREIVK